MRVGHAKTYDATYQRRWRLAKFSSFDERQVGGKPVAFSMDLDAHCCHFLDYRGSSHSPAGFGASKQDAFEDFITFLAEHPERRD